MDSDDVSHLLLRMSFAIDRICDITEVDYGLSFAGVNQTGFARGMRILDDLSDSRRCIRTTANSLRPQLRKISAAFETAITEANQLAGAAQ